MLCGCFAAGGTCALHKIDGKMRVENYIEATSQDISQEVKAWSQNGSSKWTMTPSILPKLWQNVIRTTKSRYWSDHHKPWPQSYRRFVGRTEKACVQARRPTNLTQLHQLCQEEWDKIHPTYCGKVTRNIWPKLNNLKTTLPNTYWVYVNFWPTGNVMKEIQAEINNSLYYYSDI